MRNNDTLKPDIGFYGKIACREVMWPTILRYICYSVAKNLFLCLIFSLVPKGIVFLIKKISIMSHISHNEIAFI